MNEMSYSIFVGANSIIPFSSFHSDSSSHLHFMFRENLLILLRTNNLSCIDSLLRENFLDLCNKVPTNENLLLLISEIFSTFNLYLQEIQSRPKDKTPLYAFDWIENYNDIDSIRSYCLEYLSQSLGESIAESSKKSIVSSIIFIINTNYATPSLDLTYISKLTGYTSSYISTTFKKETGFSIIQYITQCRMNAAQQLLLNTSFKIYDICEQVGYTDYFYFPFIFFIDLSEFCHILFTNFLYTNII